jgi:Fe-S cluster assembly iron-binding protein IscA
VAMDIAKSAEESDVTLEKDDLKVYLQEQAHNLLLNATLDFVDEHGFVVTGTPQSPCCS